MTPTSVVLCLYELLVDGQRNKVGADGGDTAGTRRANRICGECGWVAAHISRFAAVAGEEPARL
jgi:hypothetical protein